MIFKNGVREYKSDPNICADCPIRERCTPAKGCVKTAQWHIWKNYEDLADGARYIHEYLTLYKRRKETIEWDFADAKENTRCVIHTAEAWPRSQNG
ncbi:MAG: transposase [Christensenellales bacterium]